MHNDQKQESRLDRAEADAIDRRVMGRSAAPYGAMGTIGHHTLTCMKSLGAQHMCTCGLDAILDDRGNTPVPRDTALGATNAHDIADVIRRAAEAHNPQGVKDLQARQERERAYRTQDEIDRELGRLVRETIAGGAHHLGLGCDVPSGNWGVRVSGIPGHPSYYGETLLDAVRLAHKAHGGKP
jgi:hypothetical protein